MDRRHPVPPGGQQGSRTNTDSTTHRRARAYSQPLASPPIAGPSHQRPPPEAFDFLNNADPSTAPSSFPPLGPDFDDDPYLRSFLAEGNFQAQLQSLPPLHLNPEHMPPPAAPPMHQLPSQPQMAGNPLLSQTFMAWLQYMQLQMQLQQSQAGGQQGGPPPQPQPTNPAQSQRHLHQRPHLQQSHSPLSPQVPFPLLAQGAQGAYHQAPPQSPRTQAGSSGLPANTPSPEADEFEGEPQAIAEEKRRRNTAASARFRVKKKQWTLNLERSITDLSGRVEELEREASELRRENGWLKEIVMLKSKRFGGTAPDVNLVPPEDRETTSTSPNDDGVEEDDGENEPDDEQDVPGKGKEVQR